MSDFPEARADFSVGDFWRWSVPPPLPLDRRCGLHLCLHPLRHKKMEPAPIRSNTALTPGRNLRTIFQASTVRRLLSLEAWTIFCATLSLLVVRLPPVLLARLSDVASGLCGLQWHRALIAPRAFGSDVVSVLLDALGASFIKLAQVIAHSPMVAPAPLVSACKASLVYCKAPVVPWGEVQALLRRELGVSCLGDLFETVEQRPLASASIAQVHAATLVGGRRVAVKLVRPGVRERLSVDLDLLWLLARLADVLLGPLVLEFLSAPAGDFVNELRVAILTECDLRTERANLEAYRAWLASSTALRRSGLAGAVRAPEPIAAASSTAVLTMELLDGVPLAELRTGTAIGYRREKTALASKTGG